MIMVLADSTDLLLAREESSASVEDELGPSYFILFRNFEHNSKSLRPLHHDVVRNYVVGYLNSPAGFAELYAMTDRTGSREINYTVSAARLKSVQSDLFAQGAPRSKVEHPYAKAIGEDYYADQFDRTHDPEFGGGIKDGKRRCVVIALTPAPIGIPTKLFMTSTFRKVIAYCRLYQRQE